MYRRFLVGGDSIDKFIQSPLNYTGGKFKLLPEIMNYFPDKINTFVDLFCGGLNVGINVKADKIIANDISTQLMGIFKLMQQTAAIELHNDILKIVSKYDLSKTNADGYYALRNDYNRTHDSLLLLCVINHAFNNQIRFNSKGDFNIAFGTNRSSYNVSTQAKTLAFVERMNTLPLELSNKDFREFDFSSLKPGDVVYCDPPYSLSDATYNKFWRPQEDYALYEILDKLNATGVTFFLSNVAKHKGIENTSLLSWAKKYHVIYLEHDYSNCSYHRKKSSKSKEVLITNYKKED